MQEDENKNGRETEDKINKAAAGVDDSFDDVFEKIQGESPEQGEKAPAKEPVIPEETEETEETEKKETRGVGCLPTISYVLFMLGLAMLLSAMLILGANDMFAFSKASVSADVTITDKQDINEVADMLKDEGIIKYPFLFELFADLTDMADQIEPGEYELSSDMDYRTILRTVRASAVAAATVTVTIPEGTELGDIFEMLEDAGVCEAWRLKAVAKYYDFSYSFLKDLEYSDNRLEGYLFPDTYTFYEDDDPVRVIKKFLANFSKKLTVDMKARAGNIGYSIREVIIIASMIEKEAKFDDERPTISSVIHNRLQSSAYPYLQIDATVQYILPERKENLTQEDLEIQSPYNTYVVEGLPVGPICNPGYAAIMAALYPEDTDYYYYVARYNGWHIFSETLAEHNAAIEQVKNEIPE